MVLLHDAMKIIQKGVLYLFLQKNKNVFLFKKTKKNGFKKQNTHVNCFF